MSAESGRPAAAEVESYPLRIGPGRISFPTGLRIRSSVRRSNVGTLFFVSFFAIASMNAIGLLQPYLLNVILKVPQNEQGALTGNLVVLQEIVGLLLLAPVGALSDRFGRRSIFFLAYVALAVGYCLYPLADNRVELAFFRHFLAVGIVGINAMLPAVANDYAVDATRAKMIAATFIFNGIGIATIPKLLTSLPTWFVGMGFDRELAGRYTYWCLSSLCLLLSLVLLWGLQAGAPVNRGKREPFLPMLLAGVREGRNPRVALGYVSGLVSRADLGVISTWLTLWLVTEGTRRGMPAEVAQAKAGTFYVAIQAMALPWAPIWGWILDRVDRLKGLAAAMVVAAIGYGSLVFLEDPFGPQMWIAAAFVAAGEMAANISAVSLIGKEAPERSRGAVIGVFSLFGALGILMIAQVGALFFDSGITVGPFLFMAGANVVMVVLTLITIAVTRRAPAVQGQSQSQTR